MSCERLCVGCEKDIRCSRFLGLRKASGFDLWNKLMDWISQNPNIRMMVPKPALYNTIHPFQGSMRRWSVIFFWWLAALILVVGIQYDMRGNRSSTHWESEGIQYDMKDKYRHYIVWTSSYLTKTPASHPTIAIRNEMCSFVIGPYTACKCKSRKCQELTCKNE